LNLRSSWTNLRLKNVSIILQSQFNYHTLPVTPFCWFIDSFLCAFNFSAILFYSSLIPYSSFQLITISFSYKFIHSFILLSFICQYIYSFICQFISSFYSPVYLLFIHAFCFFCSSIYLIFIHSFHLFNHQYIQYLSIRFIFLFVYICNIYPFISYFYLSIYVIFIHLFHLCIRLYVMFIHSFHLSFAYTYNCKTIGGVDDW